jgi:GT2 family glycosyltransferase
MSVDAAVWLGWDGRQLRWRSDATKLQSTQVELRLDGVPFQRFAAGEQQCEFAYAPSGNTELEFSLYSADGAALARPWRVRRAEHAAPGIDQWHGAVRAMQALADTPLPAPEAWAHARSVAIVIPIFNSPELVQRCIDAVLRFICQPAQLILIDDASTDAGIAPLLESHAWRPGVVVRRNVENLGYTRSCNIGMELADNADVVLLNSDTEVGPRWLERLRLIAYADENIGTVTAVSDNAGAFSVPELEQYCPIPHRWTLAQTQRALLHHAGGSLPELPTGNGFCMFVKRAMLERVGVLDAQAFPAGYGEENDLCQRAEHAGFRHVIAGDVFVRHARSASFGAERRARLGEQGMAVLRARYPDYEAKVGATLFSFARRVLDYRVRRIYAGVDTFYAAQPPRPRVLIAIDSVAAGADLAAGPLARFECFVLSSDGAGAKLYRCGDRAPVLVDQAASADSQQLLAWLVHHAIELVYAADGAATVRVAASRIAVPSAITVDDGHVLLED